MGDLSQFRPPNLLHPHRRVEGGLAKRAENTCLTGPGVAPGHDTADMSPTASVMVRSPTASVMVRHARRDENVPKTQGTNVLLETRLRGTAGQGKYISGEVPLEFSI